MQSNSLEGPSPNLIPPQQHLIHVLLIDDQPIIAEAIRHMIAVDKQIVFHYCKDAREALKMALEIMPTIILQDLVMPDIDGITLLKGLKSHSKIREIPVIVLSTKEDPTIKAQAFENGAADYIVKLPNQIEFQARIRHHAEAYTRLLERNDAYEKLQESQTILKADLKNAAAYVTSLLPLPLKGDVEASWRFIPSAQLGGDAFGYHWLDANQFILYLLDVCGHGVGAALLSITIANVIRSQSLLNTDFSDPAHVLHNLNEMFPMERHNDMYFTIWYGVYNKEKRLLKYSTGGHPPALLYDLEKTPLKPLRLTTGGLVIGAIPNATFTNAYCQIPVKNRLFLLSDGVYELKNSRNEVFTLEEFSTVFDRYASESQQDLDKIVNEAKALQKGLPFVDDFSVLEFNFP